MKKNDVNGFSNSMMRLAGLVTILVFGAVGCNAVKGLGTDIHDMAQHTQVFIEDASGTSTDTRSPSPTAKSRQINRSARALANQP